MALITLGACHSERTSSGQVVRLVYWPPPNRYDLAMSRILVKRWNRSHPEIQVEMQPLPAGRSSEEVLMASIVGHTTPDICSNILTGTVERMVRAGALIPLSGRLPDFKRYVQQRSPDGTLQAMTSSDGQIYQLPWKSNPMMLSYNTEIFARHRIDLPRTYSEFLQVAARLTQDLDKDGRTDRWAIGLEMNNTWWKRFDDLYPLYIAASGGKTLLSGRQVLFHGTPMLKVFHFVREIFARGYSPRTYFAGDLFLQGKVAMLRGSAPNIPDIESKKRPGFSYDFMPMPVPDDYRGRHYTFGDIKSIVIFSSCRQPEAAWKFIKYLTSEEADLMLLTRASQIPMRRDLHTAEPYASALKRLPRLARLARRVPFVRGTDDSVHLVEIFDTLSQAYEAGAVLGLVTPEEAVDRAARRVQRILKMWE